MNNIFANICGNAVYSHQTEIANGCITLAGGHRVGICGLAIYNDTGNRQTYSNISSLCIRIAHEITGCADKLVEYISTGSKGLLLAGPPCSGKTTILRDIARQLSKTNNISIVDERNEIAAVNNGMPQLNIGQHTDVLTGQKKADGMLHAVRCMSPDILICDEIGSVEEAEATRTAFNCGVKVIAALHCGDASDLIQREQFIMLRNSGAFDTVAVLSGRHAGNISLICNIGDL